MKSNLWIGLLLVCFVWAGGLNVAAQEPDANEIDNYFQRLVAEQGFSGAVLVADESGVILQEGYGLANDVEGTLVTADTVFDIGSISKQFTAAAILHLEAQGKLNVNDPITTYLPDVPADKAGITLHHLLTHSAGFTEDHFEDDLTPLSKEEALEAIYAQALGFAPGTEYAYSNTGYTLLAMIVEAVSGQSYTSYLHENFFTLLAMEHSGFYNDEWEGSAVAQTYLNGEDQGNPAEWPGPYWGVMGNGGILSTVGDLYVWWQALENNTVLPPEQTEKMFTRHISEGSDDSFYGYGWSLQDSAHGALTTHDGGGIGGNSNLAVYTHEGLVIIISSNRIVWRTLGPIPLEVRLPATETQEQLATNIFTSDFSTLPSPTFVLWPYLAALVGVIVVGVTAVILFRRRRKKKQTI